MLIYLTGAANYKHRDTLIAAGVGLMAQPATGYIPMIPTFGVWAADNGCFSKSHTFDVMRFLEWLALLQPYQARCLFAVAPDVVGDAAATWGRSRRVLPVIRAMGYKAALVAQNGIHDKPVEWGAFDALFVGGDDTFKLAESTFALVREAMSRGKWCHMGRVNSQRRLVAAAVGGYDSADGTYLGFGPDTNLPKLMGWVEGLQRQGRFIA